MKTADGGVGCTGDAPRPDGACAAVLAHCLINTGDEPLISFCVYPADAGHNYGDIEQQGFPQRVFRKNSGEIVIR